MTPGSDWASACFPTLCGEGFKDPTPAVVSSFPADYYWSSSNGSSDVNPVLSELNSCPKDADFGICHRVDSDA